MNVKAALALGGLLGGSVLAAVVFAVIYTGRPECVSIPMRADGLRALEARDIWEAQQAGRYRVTNDSGLFGCKK